MKNKIKAIFLLSMFKLCNISAFADHWGIPTIDGPGPWNENLVISISNDKKKSLFNKKEILVKQAGVSNFVLFDKRPRLYFQWLPTSKDLMKNFDHIAYIDLNNGWSKPKLINLPFKGEPHKYPVDPTIVPLKDGKFRLYFTTVDKKNRTYISSAISSDGEKFSLENGERFRDKSINFKDCAVIYYNNLWHIITPSHKQNGLGYYGISKDGLNFERKKDIKINVRGDWLGNFLIDDGTIYFYGTGFIASTEDFKTWKVNEINNIADPAVIFFENKKYIVSTSMN